MAISQQLGSDRANPQLIQIVPEALYAHHPRKLKEPNSMKDCPAIGLNYAIWRSNYSEWILFGLARDKGAGRTAFYFPNNAVENENRYSVLLSLDYIPDLSNSPATGVTSHGKPSRERGTNLGVRGVPQFRSGGTDVLETPSGSESPHSSCAKHVDDSDHTKDQRHRGKH
jgi:hypothetical protein